MLGGNRAIVEWLLSLGAEKNPATEGQRYELPLHVAQTVDLELIDSYCRMRCCLAEGRTRALVFHTTPDTLDPTPSEPYTLHPPHAYSTPFAQRLD